MFEFRDQNVAHLPADLQAHLHRLGDDQALLTQIGAYLQKSHRRRVSLQQTVEGGKFPPRKVTVWKGKKKPPKMLQGMRQIQRIVTEQQVEVGYSGGRAALARWHNEGQVGSDGMRRTQRNWFGIGITDRKAIDNIITQHLSSR